MLAKFCFLDGIFAASDCALLVNYCNDQIVDFAGENSPSGALVTTCHNYAEPFFWFYYLGWMIILRSWYVQLRLSLLLLGLLRFFLICRRARRQRSQSPILVTVRIDKHFKLYIDWSLSGKCSQLASQVMEQSSMFLLTAQSAERKMASFTIQLLNTSITQNCTCKGRFSIVLRQIGTYRRALNCMPQ